MAESVYDPNPSATYHYDPGTSTRQDFFSTPPVSSLDELRAAVEQAEQIAEVEFRPLELFGPGRIIRLTCSTELEQSDWKNIQLASMPLAYRKKRIPDPRKINEPEAYATLIGKQTTEIAIRQADGSYRQADGAFDDPKLLAAFGAAEATVAVRRVFVNDAYLLHAGQELIEACGFGERRPGDEDPT